MKKALWKPSAERIRDADMTRFMEFVNQKYGKPFRTYNELYQWSVREIADFGNRSGIEETF